MTHDELLYMTDLGILTSPQTKALHAVVKLHKPEEFEYFDKTVCTHCSFDIDVFVYYPCDTIETIEKELTGEARDGD